jgi:hypothetical protein
MKSSPEIADSYELLIENEYVRTTRASLARMQSATTGAPIALPTVSIDLDSKKIRYSDPDSGENPETPFREIRVELKSPPPEVSLSLDAVRIDPGRYKVEFENDRVRVVRLRFASHEKGMMVTHPPRVLVTLTDVTVRLLFADGKTDQRGAPAGVAAWLEAETLQTENAGDQPLEVVLVEPKSTRGF